MQPSSQPWRAPSPHLSSGKLGWLLCWCGKSDQSSFPRFLFPFQRKQSGEVFAPQRGCCCIPLLLSLIFMTSALRGTFNKNAQQSLRQLIELSKVVEAISGNGGSIFKSAFPALCCPNSFFPAHRFLHTPADVPWVFSFPSLHRQIGFKFLNPSSFHPLNPPSLPLLRWEDVRNPAARWLSQHDPPFAFWLRADPQER